jgi:two-component system response regulator
MFSENRNKVILLVSDRQDEVELTLQAFEKSEFQFKIVVARDGLEALDYLFGTGKYIGQSLSYRPQVALIDYKLPNLNGLDVLKRMRADARTSKIPVVILHDIGSRTDFAESYDLGANSCVRKPIDFFEYMDTLRALGKYWIQINQTVNGLTKL